MVDRPDQSPEVDDDAREQLQFQEEQLLVQVQSDERVERVEVSSLEVDAPWRGGFVHVSELAQEEVGEYL